MKSLWILLLVLAIAAPASAQVEVPFNNFVSGQIIASGESNANFGTLADQALNRAGGTVTGNITLDVGLTIDGVDLEDFFGPEGRIFPNTLGTASTPAFGVTADTTTGLYFAAGQFSVTLSGTERLGLTSSALTIFGASPFGSDGRIPAISSTYFASLSGADLQIAETSIMDGSTLARLAAAETISGDWSFSGQPTVNPTWNNGSTTFSGLTLSVTDTASGAASLLLDFNSTATVAKDGKFVPVSLQITEGAHAAYILAGDSSGNGEWAESAATSPVPQGMLAFFESSCPVGWTRRGTYDDLFIRGGANYDPIGGGSNAAHFHEIDPPSTSTSTESSHTHSVDFAPTVTTSAGSHSHHRDAFSTGSAGSHTHTMNPGAVTTGDASAVFTTGGAIPDVNGTPQHTHSLDLPSKTSSSNGSHTHTVGAVDYLSAGAHTHTLNIAPLNTSAAGSHAHIVDITEFSSGSTVALPSYVVTLVCKKD